MNKMTVQPMICVDDYTFGGWKFISSMEGKLILNGCFYSYFGCFNLLDEGNSEVSRPRTGARYTRLFKTGYDIPTRGYCLADTTIKNITDS